MIKYEWIPSSKSPYEKVGNLRKFFEVSRLQLIDDPAINHIACRRLSSGEKTDYALLAWAQKAKLEARNCETKEINISGLKKAIPLIFTSPFGEPISPTNFSRRYFKPLLKECHINPDFTFHGLLHTHATLLLQQGVNPKIVQERLGHSSIKVTMDTYSHVLPDMQRQAVDALRELFK